jgi:hypothetical protein
MTKTYDKSLKDLILDTIATTTDQYLCQLLIDTYDRYDYHLSVAIKNHVFFRNMHYFLSFSIPIYSACFTYIVSNDLLMSRSLLGLIGLFLTILTIVLSILKPYERCIAAGDILIILSEWKTDLTIGLGNIQRERDEAQEQSLYEFLKTKDQELSKIGEAMMENLMPKPGTSIRESTEKKAHT